jgi:type I restriction enzyme M protein
MVSCLLICRTNKPDNLKGKVLFINAEDEIRKEKSISYLDDHHINRIVDTFCNFTCIPGFSNVADTDTILQNNGNVSVQLYVQTESITCSAGSEESLITEWEHRSVDLRYSTSELITLFKEKNG